MRYNTLRAARALLALFILLSLGAPVLGSSQAEQQRPALTLQEAVSRTLANNPGFEDEVNAVFAQEGGDPDRNLAALVLQNVPFWIVRMGRGWL